MKITIADAIQRTVEHREIFHDEMLHVMRQIMSGELTQAQIAGFVMGLRHRTLPVEGVQFHPEALLTEHGHALLKNFLQGRQA